MPCFFIYVHRVSLQSLSPLIIVFLAFSHEIILVSLYLGPLVNNFLNFFFFFIYISVIFVYKTRACTVTWWQNSIVKDFNIKVTNKFVKLKYFGPDCIGKRVYNSRIIKFDISWQAYFTDES